jgi:hypothetical protein
MACASNYCCPEQFKRQENLITDLQRRIQNTMLLYKTYQEFRIVLFKCTWIQFSVMIRKGWKKMFIRYFAIILTFTQFSISIAINLNSKCHAERSFKRGFSNCFFNCALRSFLHPCVRRGFLKDGDHLRFASEQKYALFSQFKPSYI